jgi:hypothetical protein
MTSYNNYWKYLIFILCNDKEMWKKRKGFINFILSKPNNNWTSKIRSPWVKYKNKKFYHKNIMMMYLFKRICQEIFTLVYIHRELYVPHETMLKRIVDLTSSSSNIPMTHFWALMLEENQKYISLRRVYQNA